MHLASYIVDKYNIRVQYGEYVHVHTLIRIIDTAPEVYITAHVVCHIYLHILQDAAMFLIIETTKERSIISVVYMYAGCHQHWLCRDCFIVRY